MKLEEWFSKDTGSDTVMDCAWHPKESLVAYGVAKHCHFMEYGFGSRNSEPEPIQTDFEDSEQNVVTFSHDGDLMVTGGSRVVRVWRWPSLVLLHTLQAHAGDIRKVEFSPNDTLLVTMGMEECKLWEPRKTQDNGEEWVCSRVLAVPGRTSKSRLQFCGLKFSPNGEYFYTTQAQRRCPSYVTKWHVNSNKSRTVVAHRPHRGSCCAFDLSVDGKLLATGTSEGEVKVFRTDNLQWIMCVPAHKIFVTKLHFFPDVPYLASVSGDHSLQIMEIKTTRSFVSRNIGLILWSLLVMFLSIIVAFYWK